MLNSCYNLNRVYPTKLEYRKETREKRLEEARVEIRTLILNFLS